MADIPVLGSFTNLASIPDNISTQKVRVRRNSGTAVGPRRQLNFIEGTNITLTVADDSTNDEIDITINSSPGTLTAANITDFTEATQDVMGGILVDSSTIDWTYNDGANTLSPAVIANTTTQRVEIGKAGTLIGTRKRINLIEGSNVTITVADDSGNDEVDVTIASTGSGGATNINDLGDVTITTAADSHILQYSSGQWINRTLLAADIPTLSLANTFAAAQSVSLSATSPTAIGFNRYRRGSSGGASNAVGGTSELGRDSYYGWDGNSYEIGAYFFAQSIETWDDTTRGTKFSIGTVSVGTTTAVDRFIINGNGSIELHANSTGNTGFLTGLTLHREINTGGDATTSDFDIIRTESGLGSGSNYFARWFVGGSLNFAVTSAGVITATGLTNNISTQKVTVRKNTGANVGSRQRLNFIEGSNVTLTIADDGTGDEVDITIAATTPALTSANISDFTEAAQDAVGAVLTDSTTIDFTYNDAGNTITASVRLDQIALNDVSGVLGTAKGGTGVSMSTTGGEGHFVMQTGVGNSFSTKIPASADISDFAEAVRDTIETALTDSTTIDFTVNDAASTITAAVIANSSTQKIEVSNAGTLVGTRKRINFIQGTNATLTIADDSGNDRVNVTIAATGGGSGAGVYTALIGNGSATSFTITQATHGRRSDRGNLVQVMEESTGNILAPTASVASNGDVTVTISPAPTTNSIRVTIIG